jgi:hypothetical protein
MSRIWFFGNIYACLQFSSSQCGKHAFGIPWVPLINGAIRVGIAEDNFPIFYLYKADKSFEI